MKKELKLKKDEPLHAWLDRIAEYWNFGAELRELIGEISKSSYIRGSNEATKILSK
jgi:hypothetical protein